MEMILDYLQENARGQRNSVKICVLSKKFGLSDRAIKGAVRDLRKAGFLIGSSKRPPHGYFIPDTDDELKNYLNGFRADLMDMLHTYNRQKRALRTKLSSLQGQINLRY